MAAPKGPDTASGQGRDPRRRMSTTPGKGHGGVPRGRDSIHRDRRDGSYRAFVIGLLALTSSRIVAAAIPGTWLWGIGLLRFAGPVAWAVAASPLVALIPVVDARLAGPLGQMGNHLARPRALAIILAGSLVAAMVLALPDRSHFVGDFLIRFGPLSK